MHTHVAILLAGIALIGCGASAPVAPIEPSRATSGPSPPPPRVSGQATIVWLATGGERQVVRVFEITSLDQRIDVDVEYGLDNRLAVVLGEDFTFGGSAVRFIEGPHQDSYGWMVIGATEPYTLELEWTFVAEDLAGYRTLRLTVYVH